MSTLAFGYNAGLAEGVQAAWGARLIVTQQGYTDFVFNRTGYFGETDELFAWLNSGVFDRAREEASALLAEYIMRTREGGEFVLYEDDRGKVVGNTNGSGGYLYVAAWLFADEAVEVGGGS